MIDAFAITIKKHARTSLGKKTSSSTFRTLQHSSRLALFFSDQNPKFIAFQFMELSNYGMFQTRSGLFVNRTARELLFEVNKLTKKKAFVNKFHYFEVNRTYKANVDRQWVFVTRTQRFRDRATLSLMSALFLLRRGESRWTSR